MQDPQQTPAPHAGLAQTWRRYLRFWRARPDADVDDELRFHFEMRVRDHMARGFSEAQARDAVIRRLGNLADARAECVSISTRRHRSMNRAQWIDAFVDDLKFTARSLGRQKAWTAIAVLTLALGIGANTAVFSVVNSLVLNPIAYPHADRIAIVNMQPNQGNQTGVTVTISPPPSIVRAWLAARTQSFEDLQAYYTTSVTFERRGEAAASVRAAQVLPTFPRFAGTQPLIGRMFTAQEAAAGEPVLLIGEGMWRSRYGGEPSVLGSAVTVDDKRFTIIGVLPASLRPPRFSQTTTDLWMPLVVTPERFGIALVGRLAPDVDFATATSELDTIVTRAEAGTAGAGRFRTSLMPPSQMVGFSESLFMLTGAVALVLLIACTNVAHLLLARAAGRQRELAIRAALGAGKGRLYRQMITESLVLALAGCLGGLVVGMAGVRLVVAMRPASLSALTAVQIDATVLIVALLVSFVTGIGFGIFGAFQAARQSTHETLKAGSVATSHARHHRRLRSVFVVTEMALSTTLLVGAALLVRSVIHLQTTDPGFVPEGLYSVNPGLPESRYKTDAAKKAFYDQLVQRAQGVPGVVEVTLANGAPPGFSFLIGALQLEGQAPPAKGTTSFIQHNAVSPNYFRVLGMRMAQGRTFSDSTNAGLELIVNEGFARKNWPEGQALGKRVRIIRFDGSGEWSTIVGVVADAATGGMTHDRADPVLYLVGADYYAPALIIRTNASASMIPAVRSIVASMDPHLPPPVVLSVANEMKDSTAMPRFRMLLLVSFTGLALVLAAIGLYGVMSYGVAQRTREIGIRIALGATRLAIARGVVSNGVTLALAGGALGLVGSWWATKLIDQMLYGVPRTDAWSFVAAAFVLFATAVLACVVPMRRASAVDPVIAMRAD